MNINQMEKWGLREKKKSMFYILISFRNEQRMILGKSIYIYSSFYTYKIYYWVNEYIYLKYLICLSK